MKKFLYALILVVVIAAVYIRVTDTRFVVVRDELVHAMLTNFVTPSQKFWVHRCNSVGKAAAMSEKFPGIEIDATFYINEAVGRKFDVSHDPKPSVEYPLEDFMPLFAANNTRIWFDFKNLSEANAEAALSELETLLNKYAVDRTRFIIESPNFRELKIFRDAGFYTSYYIPIGGEIFYSEEYRQNFAAQIHQIETLGCINAISFPADCYDIMKHVDTNLDYLTWNVNGERWWNFYLDADLREIVDDPQIQIILIKFPTKFDRS